MKKIIFQVIKAAPLYRNYPPPPPSRNPAQLLPRHCQHIIHVFDLLSSASASLSTALGLPTVGTKRTCSLRPPRLKCHSRGSFFIASPNSPKRRRRLSEDLGKEMSNCIQSEFRSLSLRGVRSEEGLTYRKVFPGNANSTSTQI